MSTSIIQWVGIAVCLSLVSCASARSTTYTMRVRVAQDANDRTPVPVDLVFIWDKALADQVAATTAKDWFAGKKTEFRQADPSERQLTICEWEWVPGQNVADISLAVPAAARRWPREMFVFADYRSPGPHRSKVTRGADALLELGRDDLSLSSVGKTSPLQSRWLDQACEARRRPQPS